MEYDKTASFQHLERCTGTSGTTAFRLSIYPNSTLQFSSRQCHKYIHKIALYVRQPSYRLPFSTTTIYVISQRYSVFSVVSMIYPVSSFSPNRRKKLSGKQEGDPAGRLALFRLFWLDGCCQSVAQQTFLIIFRQLSRTYYYNRIAHQMCRQHNLFRFLH